jgi:DNA-binding response OmpR family regulator
VSTDRKPLVFVVEDEPKLARLLDDYLRAADFTRIASATASTSPAVRSRHPDLILLDLMLPGCDGPVFAARCASSARYRSSWSPRASRGNRSSA